MDKMCNGNVCCQYRVLGSNGFYCSYNGYCDYQAPKDSRYTGYVCRHDFCSINLDGRKTCINCGEVLG